MRLESSFDVPVPPERAWDLLLDVPRVVPCMPGAELTEVVDDDHWKASMKVKLGPMALAFATDVAREETDAAARHVRLAARARETRGRGGARATIDSTLAPADGGTRVEIVTELALSGAIAQYGRGIVEDVSSRLVGQFADCLRTQLAGAPEAVGAAAAPAGAAAATAGAGAAEQPAAGAQPGAGPATAGAATPGAGAGTQPGATAAPSGAAPATTAPGADGGKPAAAPAKPVSGLSLIFGALARAFVRFFRRLLGGRQGQAGS
jgi:carbon monoxide dehydrogenase subunit G